MSAENIIIVRSIIQDKPIWIKQSSTPLSNPMQLKYFPLQDGSLMILNAVIQNEVGVVPNVFSIDDSNGVIVFEDNPAGVTADLAYYCYLLSDSDIQTALTLENVETCGEDIRLAAADCLDMIASNQAIIQKKISIDGLDVDGPALATALRAHASNLRKQVYDATMQDSTFDVIEEINDIPGFREKVLKDYNREGIG